MKIEQIQSGLWYIGAIEENLRIFGPSSFSDSGLMYNTYLIETEDGFISLGSLPEVYAQKWADAVKELTSGNLKWSVFFGADSDRRSVKELLERFPNLTVIGGCTTLYKLDGFVEREFAKVEIRSERSLILGNQQFDFRILADKFDTPSLYFIDKEKKALICADAFGAVYASQKLRLSDIEEKDAYYHGAQSYYNDIFGYRRKKTMKAAVNLLKEEEIQLICPALGPLADAEIDSLIQLYTDKEETEKKKTQVAIVYTPNGYIQELAELIETGIQDCQDIQTVRYDLSRISRDKVIQELRKADALLFGTPEIRQDASKAIWDIVTSLSKEDLENKLTAVFTTTSSKGNAAENLKMRLKGLGADLNTQDYSVQGKPDSQQLKNAYEYGFAFGCSVLKIPNPRKPALVKCLVCGEIFDASLGICPVCGVGLELCVPVDAEEVGYKVKTDRRYVILGGGIAAVSAAESIRQRDETGEIIMLSAEPELPINRPMLTKDLKTVEQDPDSLKIHPEEWYKEHNITLYTSTRAAVLNPEKKTVCTDEGAEYRYDKLILATGAECFVPPFSGHDKKEVLTIRHLDDNVRLAKLLKTAKKAVVIGGGVLGLEAASELMRAGIKVTVLEATPQIIGRQADAKSAAILKEKMKAMQVDCHEGVSIAAIEGQDKVTGVRLESGEFFEADFVIVSCGNRGNVEIARNAGILVDRAIVVNQFMETNLSDIYACGDCCQFDNINYQLWQEASSQGKTAGANAAGERIAYVNQLLPLSMEGFGTSLFAIGDAGKKELAYKKVELSDQVDQSYEQYWFLGGSLEGAVIIGKAEKAAKISEAVTTHARHKELFK